MLNYKFNPTSTYIVAVTYGPDSMALLDMLQKEGIRPVVCCVNYHVSPTADEDYGNLRLYCKDKGLDFEYFDTNNLKPEDKLKEGEDFKFWARRVRYDFFHEVYIRRDAEALFLAHQLDDVIESYLLEKEGKEKPGKYGISPVSDLDGMIVVRPLLQWTHHDLVSYVEEHRIPYSKSSEVFEIEHLQNGIRKNVISRLNAVEREQILEEMRAKKEGEIRLTRSLQTAIEEGEELSIRSLIALPRDEFASTLVKFVAKADEPVKLHASDIDAIRKFMLNRKTNDVYRLGEKVCLVKTYDFVFLSQQFDTLPYTYVLEAPGKMSNEHFVLDFSMGAEDRGITAEDYPLTIRSAIPSDAYVNHGFLQSVYSSYSVWKMPAKLRGIWPIFLNKDGKIIYVPRYAMNFREHHTSILRLRLPDANKIA